MSQNKETHLPSQSVIETRWLTMVNEIQQQHNVLIDLIEQLEQDQTTNQKTVFRLTRLQQHVLDTLTNLLAESLTEMEPLMPSPFSDRLQKKHVHSQVLIQLKQQIEVELNNIQ